MTQLLKSSLEALKCLRVELHGKVEDSVINRLDEIILDLEILQENDIRQYDPVHVLRLLSSAIELIPSIGKLIEYLMQMHK
jgi:hypothetical protein